MREINLSATQIIQSEMLPRETVLWAGMPTPGVVLHSDDWALIPFSLLWTGFFVFWEGMALGWWASRNADRNTFMVLWGIPFLIMGNYIVWADFLVTPG